MDSVEATGSRTIQGIRFTDDLAWMESMKGPRWERLIKDEQEKWSKAVSSLSGSTLSRLRSQIKKATSIGRQMRFVSGPVEIAHIGTMAYQWKWKGSHHVRDSNDSNDVADICTSGNTVFVSYEDTKVAGAENYVIAAFERGKDRPLWKRANMSPYVAVLGGRCYSIEAKNKIVYYKCVSWDVNGGDYRTEYEEKDARYNLELMRGTDVIFLRRQSGPKQDIIQITAESKLLKPISLESTRFVVGSRADEYLHWCAGKWTVSKGLQYTWPDFDQTPELLDTDRDLLITRREGKRTLWSISKHTPRIVWSGIGNIFIDPWEGPWIRITQPGVPIAWIRVDQASVQRLSRPVAQSHFTTSADGTQIPFYTVGPANPKGLFIAAYSAYGIYSSFSTARWRPLLAEGWAIAFGVYRGSGDHTPEWEDDGRLGGRMKVLEDAEAVVRAARHTFNMPASRTVLYGRSAGGLWVGGLCSRHPDGDFFGGAYMEVPYLDVLRTTTNLELPLTLLETDEFGLPAMRLSDFAGMLKWSPMETLPLGGTPGIFQIVRTGINDSQVFAYESAKWVTRSRGQSKNAGRIFLAIEGDQGHFVNGDKGLQQQAEDISILLKLAEG